MTLDEILAMARAAGLQRTNPGEAIEVVRFAAMVAAKEREACAQVCEAEHVGADVCDDCDNEADETYNRALRDGATAIRERGAA